MANENSNQNVASKIDNHVKQANDYVSSANMAVTEMRIQFETLAEMQKEERIETQKLFKEEKDGMRKHYGRIIIGLIIALCVLIGSIAGAIIYILSNYDIMMGYTQNAYNKVGGDNIINDGIHFNDGFRDDDN